MSSGTEVSPGDLPESQTTRAGSEVRRGGVGGGQSETGWSPLLRCFPSTDDGGLDRSGSESAR